MSKSMQSEVSPKKSVWGLLKKLFFLCLLLFAVSSFLPRIVSSRLVSQWLLTRVNADSPVQVSVEKLNLSWNRGFSAEGVSLLLENESRIDIHHITGQAGIIPLWRDRALGEVVIDGLAILWQLPAAPLESGGSSTSSPSPSPAQVGVSSPNRTPEQMETLSFPNWPELTGMIRVLEGSFSIQAAGKEAQLIMSAIEARLDLLDGVSLGALSVVAPFHERKGKLVLLGDLKNSNTDVRSIDQLALNIQLTLRGVDLAEQEDWLIGLGGLTQAKGQVNGSLNLEGILAEGLKIKASILASDLKLQTKALGTDVVALDDFQLDGRALLQSNQFVLEDLTLNSDLGTVYLKPDELGAAQNNYTVESKIDLARLVSLFPETLGLKEGLVVNEGVASLDASVGIVDGVSLFQGAWVIDSLAGESGGQAIRLDEAIRVDCDLAWSAQSLDVKALNFNSSFLTAMGQGDLSDFELNATLDLAGGLEELGQFVDLKDLAGRGEVTLRVGIKEAEDAESYITEGALNFSQIDITALKTPSGEPWDGSLRIQGSLRSAETGWKMSEQVFFNIPWGQGRVSLRDVGSTSEGEFEIPNWQAKGHLDFGPWMTEALRSLFSTQAVFDLEGSFQSQEILLAQGSLSMDSAKSDGPGIESTFAGKIDLAKKSLALNHLQLTGPGIAVSNDGVITERGGRLELSADLALLQQAFDDSSERQLQGTLVGKVELETKGRVQAQLALSNLLVREQDISRVQMTKGRLSLELVTDEQGLEVKNLSIESPGLQVNSTGRLSQGESSTLHLEGDLAYDLGEVIQGFPFLKEEGIKAEGQSHKPFFIDWPLSGSSEDRFDRMKASLALMAETVEAYGLEFTELEIPVSADAGTLSAAVVGRVEQGTINFMPTLHFTDQGPVLMVNTGEEVISKIELTPELADRILGRIHPLFKGAALAEGRVSVRFNDFEMPLAGTEKNQGSFSGVMYFRNVKLGAQGAVKELFSVAKIDASDFDVGDRDLAFVCRNGQIETDPLKIQAKGEEILLYGKMALTGELDYIAEVPLSEALVGRELASYAGNQSLKIPIGGTASHPKIDRDAVKKSLAGLSRDVGKDLIREQIGEKLGEDAQKVLDKLFR